METSIVNELMDFSKAVRKIPTSPNAEAFTHPVSSYQALIKQGNVSNNPNF